ncbi:MAG: hypothetical protein SGJ00_11610 [bacterium]|nr:hypothetical protein [bacterium]
MKNLMIIAAIAVLGLSSCKKDLMDRVTPTSKTQTQDASKFAEIRVQENFDWKTSKEFTMNVAGLETIAPINSTIKVTSDDGKIVFYQGLHGMNESFQTKFMVPAHIKGIIVSFGSISKNYGTLAKQIQFNYLTDSTAE